jgi:hypothetical protein
VTEALEQVERIAFELIDTLPAHKYEVFLLADPAQVEGATIAERIPSIDPPPDGITEEVPGLALVRISPFNTRFDRSEAPIQNPLGLPVLSVTAGRCYTGPTGDQPISAIVCVYAVNPDDRAEQFLTHEARYFSKGGSESATCSKSIHRGRAYTLAPPNSKAFST